MFRVVVLGFGVWGLESRVRFYVLCFMVYGSGTRVHGLGFEVWSLWFRDQGLDLIV